MSATGLLVAWLDLAGFVATAGPALVALVAARVLVRVEVVLDRLDRDQAAARSLLSGIGARFAERAARWPRWMQISLVAGLACIGAARVIDVVQASAAAL